jgi:ABC-type multidrug transport system fused ATPase/permease subunit
VVNQEPRLFPSDVSSNIRYGAVGESDSAVQRAAELANAHDFIALLPEGYGTKMGEGRLSGGQQQRVAIARALIR